MPRVGHLVDIVVGDAVEYLATVPPESVGLLFIDADKKSYPAYLKHGFRALEWGGLLVADDAFARGDFTGEAGPDPTEDREVRAIAAYARAVGRSPLLLSAFVGTENGMLISVKEKPADG